MYYVSLQFFYVNIVSLSEPLAKVKLSPHKKGTVTKIEKVQMYNIKYRPQVSYAISMVSKTMTFTRMSLYESGDMRDMKYG